MGIVLTAAYCILFYYLIRKSNFFQSGTVAWLPATLFVIKCVSGILLGLLYTYYYTNHQDADSFKFFTDSKILFDTLFTRPCDFIRMQTGVGGRSHDLLHYYMEMNSWLNTNTLYNDNRTIVRLNSLFRFFSGGYYNVHVVFLNFISFTGLFCLYKTFVLFCREKQTEMLLLTFLLPSVIFWGSGLLKDGLLITGFGLFIYSFAQWVYKGPSVRRILFLFLGLVILVLTKVYVILILLPGLFAWRFSRNASPGRSGLIFLAFYSVYLVTAFSAYRYNDDYNVAAEIFYKQKNFIEIAERHAASVIAPVQYECSGPSILAHSPEAFLNTLFRPFFMDVRGNPMILLSALENLLLVLLLLLTLMFFKPCRREAVPFALFNLFFILLLFILIGLITPILGAMVRYRIIALPSLMFLVVLFYDREKLIRKFSAGKRK
jgi:hypothetical protein